MYMLLTGQLLEDELADLGEGTMSDVMDQRGGPHALPLSGCQSEPVSHHSGKMTGADAVFEPAVPCSGINEVRDGELLDTAQALESG
jgi:hypothetical protein